MTTYLTRAAGMIAIAATVGFAPRVSADEPAGGMTHQQMCDKACDDCGRSCDTCATHCLKLIVGGDKHHLATLKTCQDCAAVCQAASCIVAKSGPFSDIICSACAEACKRCGDACEQHGAGDPIMKACSEECRKCETACREMLKHAGHMVK